MSTPFEELIAFMREFIELSERDGGFMPMCACGHEKGENGAILLREGEWLVRCPACLATEPQDDIQPYDTGEVISLTLSKYGRIVTNQPDGDGWKITHRPRLGQP